MRRFIYIVALILALAFKANADVHHDGHDHSGHNHSSPISHAPIGVMGDHMHKEGEWMTSYRYMYMDMDKIYAGSQEISVGSVHNDFMISPVTMDMHMHMVGVMYGLTDEVTLMTMIPYIEKEMSHVRRTDGATFSTQTSGIGDIKLSGMFSLERYFDQNVQMNLGVSLPTGSIDERGNTVMGNHQKLPYPMQLGSGTFDFHPSVGYYDISGKWNWGSQFNAVIRNGRNGNKYTLGHEYNLTSWIAYEMFDWMSTSFRVKASKRGHIRGRDQELNVMMVPTADTNNYAHERVDLLFGANIVVPDGLFKDHRLAFEIGMPAYIHAEGPQLMTDLTTTIGWQKAF